MRQTFVLACVVVVIVMFRSGCLAAAPPSSVTAFELRDGDRVVLIGSAFTEREQLYGYVEAALLRRWPDHRVTFRNLGWSGDTVFGNARSYFDLPAAGFARLVKQIQEMKPTVALVDYGWAESWKGPAGLPAFVQQYRKLIDVLHGVGARVYLASPPPSEPAPPSLRLPDPGPHNRQMKLYAQAIANLAGQTGCGYVDLFTALGAGEARRSAPISDDGIQLNALGYWSAAPRIERAMGLAPLHWSVEVDAARPSNRQTLARLSSLDVRNADHVAFTLCDAVLPLSPAPPHAPADAADLVPHRVLKVTGLAPGRYVLKIDGERIVTADAAAWAVGVTLTRGPEFFAAEKLRRLVVQKNALFFNRYRPANETYLFGFRRHEQGKNAKEVPEFDPLIVDKEQQIQQTLAPEPHRYDLSRVQSGK